MEITIKEIKRIWLTDDAVHIEQKKEKQVKNALLIMIS